MQLTIAVVVMLLLVKLSISADTNLRIPLDTTLEIELGAEQGISKTSSISADTLKKILLGVDAGNKENIYFYGLLKLYGISVSKNLLTAYENFKRASQLGHKEATTAAGVMAMTGMGIDKNKNIAIQYFRKAIVLEDFVSTLSRYSATVVLTLVIVAINPTN